MTFVKMVPAKQITTLYLLRYRLLALAYVAFLALSGLRDISGVLLAFAIIYTALLLKFRSIIINELQSRPYLIVLDVLISYYFVFASNIYETPYFLYSLAPLMLGGFLFGYRSAFLLSGIEGFLLVVAAKWSGYSFSKIFGETGESVITYFFFYFFVAIIMAYLSDLLDKLEIANKRKETAESGLREAKKCLELSLVINQLSLREMQVLTLSSEGKTIDKIAAELEISNNTVKTYLRRIYEKLGVSSKKEAIALIARQEALVE
ncbi:MAG TPA: helix-turn-helix transcriptional regulator [Anaerolineae bacterium]|nr:helix-turn-helix transcriptional regulator [Anaerolineae bacterium]